MKRAVVKVTDSKATVCSVSVGYGLLIQKLTPNCKAHVAKIFPLNNFGRDLLMHSRVNYEIIAYIFVRTCRLVEVVSFLFCHWWV